MMEPRSSSVTGTTEPRSAKIPTTCSVSSRKRGVPLLKAARRSTLPTRRCRFPAAIWVRATSAGLFWPGRRPASSFGLSTSCP